MITTTTPPQILSREVFFISVKRETNGEFISGQKVVTETQHSFTQSTKVEVGLVEGILPFFGHFNFFSVDENGAAPI